MDNIKSLGAYQALGFSKWKGMTTNNHISAMWGNKQEFQKSMTQLLAFQRGKTLDTFLSQYPVHEFEDEQEYSWRVVVSGARNIPLKEARDENGVVVTSATQENVGVNTNPFYLVFAEDWFGDGEVLHGNLNQVYPLRVLGDPVQEGSDFVYKVELMNGSSQGMPAERLLEGERFSYEYAPVEKELSRKVGTVRHHTPIAMRNEWSKVRIWSKVPGTTMLSKKILAGFPIVDKNGNTVVKHFWMEKEIFEVENTFREYKNNAMVKGVSNRNTNGEYLNFGKSGEAIQVGAGLFEQMEAGNTVYTNNPSLELLEEVLFDLLDNKVDYGNRQVILRTGSRGSNLFSKLVLNSVSGWQVFSIDNSSVNVVRKTSSKLSANALAAGYQFTEYVFAGNIRVKVDVDPSIYDDPVSNKIEHPLGGKAQSYRWDIMYVGNGDDSNIFKCQIKGKPEFTGYMSGPFANPYTGATNIQQASYDEDSAQIHKIATLGICVKDPTKCVSVIPAVLAG